MLEYNINSHVHVMGPGILLHAGAIPPELGQLGALEQLLLSTNGLSGKRNNFNIQQLGH